MEKCAGPHIRVNQISGDQQRGHAAASLTYKGSLNAAVFLLFLQGPILGASRKILLIADRLQAHKTPEVEAWVAENKERIEVFYLPPYAPELNPVEYLNNDMKEQVNKGGLPNEQGPLQPGGGVHGLLVRHPETCHQLFHAPLRPIRRSH